MTRTKAPLRRLVAQDVAKTRAIAAIQKRKPHDVRSAAPAQREQRRQQLRVAKQQDRAHRAHRQEALRRITSTLQRVAAGAREPHVAIQSVARDLTLLFPDDAATLAEALLASPAPHGATRSEGGDE